MAEKRSVGAVFINELQAAEAIRALHFWNRAQRPRPLGGMCVVARRRSGRARYLPYRMPRASRGAWRGLLLGLLAAGVFGVGAGAARGVFLDDTLAGARQVAETLSSLFGRGLGFDVDQVVALARSSALAGAVTLGVGYGLAGAVVGALVGGLLGALFHGLAGFRRPVRGRVAEQLRLGGAAILAWARGEVDESVKAEVRRLGGELRSDLMPAVSATPSLPTATERSA